MQLFLGVIVLATAASASLTTCKINGQFIDDTTDECSFFRCDYGGEPWLDEYGNIVFVLVPMKCPRGAGTATSFDETNPCGVFNKKCIPEHIHPKFHHAVPQHPHIVPEVPQPHEAPEIPEAPAHPEVPAEEPHPDVPEAPAAPAPHPAPEVPAYPDAPEPYPAPEVPEHPDVAEAPAPHPAPEEPEASVPHPVPEAPEAPVHPVPHPVPEALVAPEPYPVPETPEPHPAPVHPEVPVPHPSPEFTESYEVPQFPEIPIHNDFLEHDRPAHSLHHHFHAVPVYQYRPFHRFPMGHY